ncbi:AMP phosphorylase [Geoglobus acetivorans]|uniref:AMP phosphorylase n=1 Tax=Geoglobus acetivorans TaxID=565033 RepID=A0ABZ3H2F4_GEOAI|nr:AMP phosphorylase [Geoglobus acetivorans]
MKVRAAVLPINAGKFAVALNQDDAAEIGVSEGDRIRVIKSGKSVSAIVQIAFGLISRGKIGVYEEIAAELNLKDGDEVDIYPISRPSSVEFIRKKLSGKKYSREELYSIISDVVDGNLAEVELTAFVLGSYLVGMDFDEIEWMTKAMIDTGEAIEFEKGVVVDKHSIGGVPGNKVSLLIVPIIAASGLLIPKTASRAITSASGTADTMEVLADVNMSVEEIKEITLKTGGVIAWGGATNIAPADDKIIRVEYPLSIDPRPQLLASVMAKKGAVGARHVAIDIPAGNGTKISSVEEGRKLAGEFVELGRRLGLNVSCAITNGSQPVGRTVGPALEAWEALKTLEERKGSSSLIEKSLGIAGLLFEISGFAQDGYDRAKMIFESGKAHQKLLEIIQAQGSKGILKSDDIPIGEEKYVIESKFEGAVVDILNQRVVRLARLAGAPKDKGAGVYIHRKRGEVVKKGDPLITIYAETAWKLEKAIEYAMENPPIVVSGMILEKYPSFKVV